MITENVWYSWQLFDHDLMDQNPYESPENKQHLTPPPVPHAGWQPRDVITLAIVIAIILGIIWALLQPAC